MEFHGVKEKADMWINYFPNEVDGVDDRIIDFVRDVYNRGMLKYNEHMQKYWKKQEEAQEKETLKILKQKYPHD